MPRFILAAITGAAIGMGGAAYLSGPLMAQTSTDEEHYRQLELFGDVLDRIRTGYVEDVDSKELVEAAINGMLTSLDPHSSFLSADAAADMRVETRGAFGGLGIEVTQEEGFIKVVTPMDGTPAFEAGMQPGDFITHVDGVGLLGLTLNDAVDLMRGPIDSEIVITVVREGTAEPFDVTIIRAEIKVPAVRTSLVSDIVVQRIATFNEQTLPGVEEGIENTLDEAGGIEGVDGFILDLRNNPGGLLNQAIYVSDAFLEQGEIVSTRGRGTRDNSRTMARAGDLAQGKPIVVLINGGSASASEIVAGALQDHRRAIIVGTKSFGKGSVQTLLNVPGGGAMRLTTARYYTPSGRSIQALGVAPDIIVEQPPRAPVVEGEDGDEDRPERTERSLRGSLENDSLTEEQRLQIEAEREQAEKAAELRDDDYQLAYAIDILKGLAAIATEE